jgi:hypothetical protein
MQPAASEITAHLDSKAANLLVKWRAQLINFGSVRLAEDGSFYFISGFHDGSYSPTISFGESNLNDGKFHMQKASSSGKAPKDTHFSLHPDGQTMLFRQGHKGPVLSERKIDWFPVTKPFNMLRLYSPPLTDCLMTPKNAGLIMPVPDIYDSSLGLVIDIFPRDTTQHNPHAQSVWINFGYSPHYMVRISLNYTSQRVPALLFWPEDNQLTLE